MLSAAQNIPAPPTGAGNFKDDSHYYRVVLKEEDLDYIFTRINLLD
jgi:hypothetical protein